MPCGDHRHGTRGAVKRSLMTFRHKAVGVLLLRLTETLKQMRLHKPANPGEYGLFLHRALESVHHWSFLEMLWLSY